MIEGLFAAFMNLSWQMVLIFGMAWLSLAMFRIRSSSARHVIWLAVVLCPLALVPINVLPSETAIFSIEDFEGVVTTGDSWVCLNRAERNCWAEQLHFSLKLGYSQDMSS